MAIASPLHPDNLPASKRSERLPFGVPYLSALQRAVVQATIPSIGTQALDRYLAQHPTGLLEPENQGILEWVGAQAWHARHPSIAGWLESHGAKRPSATKGT